MVVEYICKLFSAYQCQKPKLLLKAKEVHHLKLEECYVVGDTGSTDMLAANKAGMKKVLVKTGWGGGP